jgi:hypothetical protein
MEETKMPFGFYGVIIIIALGIAALYFAKDSLLKLIQGALPNKDAPTSTQTGTTATGEPIVGDDVKYVNPAICALTGKFCDPNTDANTNPANIVGFYNGVPVRQQDYGYTVSPVGQGTTRYCMPDPALQLKKAQEIVGKLNKGTAITLDEAKWAKTCEPALFNMLGSDLKSQVLASAGVQ